MTNLATLFENVMWQIKIQRNGDQAAPEYRLSRPDFKITALRVACKIDNQT